MHNFASRRVGGRLRLLGALTRLDVKSGCFAELKSGTVDVSFRIKVPMLHLLCELLHPLIFSNINNV